MTEKLFCQAVIKFIMGVLVVGILLFLPAGTFDYWQAWLLLAVLFIPMLSAGIVMILKSPELLRKRLNVDEKETEQKQVIALSGIMFFAAFIVA